MTAAARSRRDMAIRLIRLSGLGLIAAGLAVFFNLGNISGIMGLNDDIKKLLGGASMMLGLVDVIVLPRIFGHKKTV